MLLLAEWPLLKSGSIMFSYAYTQPLLLVGQHLQLLLLNLTAISLKITKYSINCILKYYLMSYLKTIIQNMLPKST